jgi:hypothetical protein
MGNLLKRRIIEELTIQINDTPSWHIDPSHPRIIEYEYKASKL